MQIQIAIGYHGALSVFIFSEPSVSKIHLTFPVIPLQSVTTRNPLFFLL